MGITWDLRPSCSPYIGGKLLGDGSLPMQGDLEGLFLFSCDNVRSTSHAVKSACQPKGWRTSFGLTSAKLQNFDESRKKKTAKL